MTITALLALFSVTVLALIASLVWNLRARKLARNLDGFRLNFEAVSTQRRLIAHATGGSELGNYPNAVECLDAWYERGVRYFEFDLQWTSDGQLVGLHDWGPTFRRWFDVSALPWPQKLLGPLISYRGLSSQIFSELPMRGGLTMIDPHRLHTWLTSHPDAWLVTDLKRDNSIALKTLSEILGPLTKRLLAQVFSLNEIQIARQLGYGKVGWANYVPRWPVESLPESLDQQPLDVVVLNQKTIRDPATHPSLEKLRQRGLDVWVFTVNHPETLNDLPESINGIITDRLLPAPDRAV
jgi:glycerophosphoryl diester phosphodiesterase